MKNLDWKEAYEDKEQKLTEGIEKLTRKDDLKKLKLLIKKTSCSKNFQLLVIKNDSFKMNFS